MAVVILGTYNVYSAVFSINTGIGSLAISGITGFDLTNSSLNSVWDSTQSVFFNCERVTVTYAYVAGLPVWTVTFFSLPPLVSAGDTLVITLNIPDEFLDYSVLQKIAAA